MTALALLCVLRQAPILSDPTFLELGKLIGDWERRGPKATIKQHFEYGVEGKVIRGTGSVIVDGKIVLFIHSNLGWDPVAKKVTYVDFHNEDTIYMGYVTFKDGWLNYDFKEFADQKKVFHAKSRFKDANHYEFSVGPEVLTLERKA